MDVMVVQRRGVCSTIQDVGRSSGLASGIPPGGAADQYAFSINNLVLGNPPNCAALELILYGGRFKVLNDTHVAVTGADVRATVNGRELPIATQVAVRRGDLLETRAARRGCFAYLGVSGGFDGSLVLGSRSTYVEGAIGGFGGRPVAEGDVLKSDNRIATSAGMACPAENEQLCSPPTRLRFTRGPQSEYFGERGYSMFTSEQYRVSTRSSRIGYRLEGRCPPLESIPRTPNTGSGPTDIIEEGNAVGAIQIAGGQEVICLGRDCGTSGAYAKIGCLIGVDVSRLAQLKPGDPVGFSEVTVADAAQLRREYEERLSEVATRSKMLATLAAGTA